MLVTDGATDPIRLLARESERTKYSDSAENVSSSSSDNSISCILEITPNIVYPLGSQVPCLRARAGYYILALPDQHYYGLVFPDGYPDEAIRTFEYHLAVYCFFCAEKEDGTIEHLTPMDAPSADSLQIVTLPNTDNIYSKIAGSVTVGASYATMGIGVLSGYVASGIEATSKKLAKSINPTDDPVKVHPILQKSVGFVKSVTPTAVYISRGCVSAMTSAAELLAKALVPKLSKSVGPSNPHLNGIASVGSATANAALSIWEGLAEAGQVLLDTTQRASVQVVEQKYGPEIGLITRDLMQIGKDVYQTQRNISSIGIKSLAKGSIKAAGKQIANQVYSNNSKELPHSSQLQLAQATELQGIAMSNSTALLQAP